MATNQAEVAHAAYTRLSTLDRPTLALAPGACIRQVFRDFEISEEVSGAKDASTIERATEALWMLSPVQRAALVLTRRHGMTYEEIAQRIGKSEDEVRHAFASGMLMYLQYVG
jgi:DNA-directed RNA polymerase specialized sigma24 family protein